MCRQDHTPRVSPARANSRATHGPRMKWLISWREAGPAFGGAKLASENHMRVRVFVGVLPCALMWAATSFANVMVLPVKATNLEPGAAEAIGEVVTSSYQTEAKETYGTCSSVSGTRTHACFLFS